MIRVVWQDPVGGWFEDWKRRATEETEVAVAAKASGSQYDFKATIWTELKNHLAELLHNKCAYCESKIRHVMPADMEHHRPKSKVTGCSDHPGYYWLAYAPLNLLLSCELCNRAGGKMNQFPVENDLWCKTPTDPQIENPLLVNPYVDDPREHLTFTPPVGETPVGTIKGITQRGERTVTVCRLDRKELDEERRAVQRSMIDRLKVAIVAGNIGNLRTQLGNGEMEYSAACLVVAEAWIDNIKEQWIG